MPIFYRSPNMKSKPTLRQLLFRPVIFVTISLGLLVIGELVAIGRITWMNNQRLHTIETDIGQGRHLEETIFELLNLQLKLSAHKGTTDADKSQMTEIENQLIETLQSHSNHTFDVSADLRNLQDVFAKAIEGDQQQLTKALALIRQVLDKQAQEEEKLLINVEDDGRLELQLAILLPLLLFGVSRYFFKTNVSEPLDSLKDLLSGLAEGDMQPIERETSDPLLHALFDRYNHLVSRLLELEQEHLNYTSALELRVRQTSHALLEQSQQLAKAERFAALAELAASTAHELRNPLASIQLALENMLQECQDSDLAERLQLVYQEVQRLTRNLNDLLASARSSTVSSQTIQVKQALEDLLRLLKYQAQESISFNYDVADDLQVFLPENEFRQVLLNLLLNSIQAIGAGSGTVSIVARREAERLLLTVSDTGHGFDADFLRHGIRPFVSLKDGGTGLGLSMVQRFVKDHQGQLKLENDAAGHASVTLNLAVV